MKMNKSKKGFSAEDRIMKLLLIVFVTIVLLILTTTYLLTRGGDAARGLISGVNDFDGDGIKNSVDKCKPAACDPGDREVEPDPSSPRHGCAEDQEITLSLYADTCNQLAAAATS